MKNEKVMKDYYKIMEVPYDATQEDIRKAYHSKAKKYHPDANPGNTQAASVFLDIQEAYEVLSDEYRRHVFHLKSNYPLRGEKKKRAEVTAETILTKCRMLNESIAGMGKYRINHKLISKSVDAILNRENMAILAQEKNMVLKESVMRKLIQAMNILPYRMLPESIGKLLLLAGNEPKLRNKVLEFSSRKRKYRFWESYNLGIIAVCTILICLLILLLS